MRASSSLAVRLLAALGLFGGFGGFLTASAARYLRRPLDQEVDASPLARPTPPAAPAAPPPAEDATLDRTSGSLIAMQFSPDPLAGRDTVEMIFSGELRLASIRLSPRSLSSASSASDGGYASDVTADFCAYDPSSNRLDPAKWSSTSDIMAASDHCGEHRRSLPLGDVVAAVRTHDASGGGLRSLPVSGLLFHEGYSGAGLISNALTTFDSTLVVSEHPALRDALGACDVARNRHRVEDCSDTARLRLVEDVVALLARTNDPSVYKLYLRLSSQSAAYLSDLRALYPDAAWAFVYRNPEHALAKAMGRGRKNGCVKARRNPSQALASKSYERNIDLEALSHHEVCALHLSTLLDAAAKEHQETGTGILISYDEVLANGPEGIVDEILPRLGLREEIASDPRGVRERVAEVLSLKSNATGRRDRRWNGESVEVSSEAGEASRAFLAESMGAVERMRHAVAHDEQ